MGFFFGVRKSFAGRIFRNSRIHLLFATCEEQKSIEDFGWLPGKLQLRLEVRTSLHSSSYLFRNLKMNDQIQTAGESQYQDQHYPSNVISSSYHDHPKTDPTTNPFASPPPAAAPPPPPPSDSDTASVRSVNMGETDDDGSSSSGYQSSPAEQHKYPSRGSGGASRSYISTYQSSYASVPAITNYGISPAQTFYPKGAPSTAPESHGTVDRYLKGDTSVRPNTGQTNDEIGGLGSLREVTSRLRWITIGCTLSALIWEGFAFPTRLLLHTWDHPAKVVLGGYLAFFCLLLLGVELNAPMRDLFGVLYHPLGRGFLLALLSTMCYGISIAWWELFLCMAFAGCSGGYIYAYVKYPEYRRWQDYNDNRIWSDIRQRARQAREYGSSSAQWADPLSTRSSAGQIRLSTSDQSWVTTQRETQSLLHQV